MSEDRPNGGERRARGDEEQQRPRAPRRDDERERARPPRRDDERERARPQRRDGAPERPGPSRRDDHEERARRPRPDGDRDAGSRPREEPPLDALAASRLALEALQSLTSRTAEGVIGVERTDEGGWLVVVELLEASRVPATSDVLGEYEVEIGADRSLRAYSRRSRYTRASTMSD